MALAGRAEALSDAANSTRGTRWPTELLAVATLYGTHRMILAWRRRCVRPDSSVRTSAEWSQPSVLWS